MRLNRKTLKRYQTKDCQYDKETKLTKLTIATPFGDFIGYSKPHEEEKVVSEFYGSRVALSKALIKYAQELIRMNHFAIKTLKTVETQNPKCKKATMQEMINLAADSQSLWDSIEQIKKMLKNWDEERTEYYKDKEY